jgi:hypothetical protein
MGRSNTYDTEPGNNGIASPAGRGKKPTYSGENLQNIRILMATAGFILASLTSPSHADVAPPVEVSEDGSIVYYPEV